MSQKYTVLADVEGEIRILLLRTNTSAPEIEELCRQMAEKLFAGRSLGALFIRPQQ